MPMDPHSLTGKAREGEVRNNAEMDRRVKEIAERSRREGHTGEVTIRFVDPATLPPSKVMAFKEKVCALPTCSKRFVPTGARQKYHTPECARQAKAESKSEARSARAAERIRQREAEAPPAPEPEAPEPEAPAEPEAGEGDGLSSDRSPKVAEEPSAIADPGSSIDDDLDEAQRRLRAEHPPGDGSLRDRYTELLFAIAERGPDMPAVPRDVLDRIERLVDDDAS